LCENALDDLFQKLDEQGVDSLQPNSYDLGFDTVILHDLRKVNDDVCQMATENVDFAWSKTENVGDHTITCMWDPVSIISRLYKPYCSPVPLPQNPTQKLICYKEWIRADEQYHDLRHCAVWVLHQCPP
jgi:hypothetical protein